MKLEINFEVVGFEKIMSQLEQISIAAREAAESVNALKEVSDFSEFGHNETKGRTGE